MIDILNSICEHLASKFEYPIYIDTLPNDFKRPSFYVELIDCVDSDLTTAHQKRVLSFQITYFGSQDEYKTVSAMELMSIQNIISKLFYRSLKVENDYIKINQIDYTKQDDLLIINLNLIFDLEIKEDNPLKPSEILEIMKELNIKFNGGKNNEIS